MAVECGECGREFPDTKSFQKHYIENHLRHTNKCPFCGESTKDLDAHFQEKHDLTIIPTIVEKQLYPTDEENNTVSEDYPEEQETPINEEVEETPPPQTTGKTCSFCGQVFPNIGQLTKHQRYEHPEEYSKIKQRQLEKMRETLQKRKAMKIEEEMIEEDETPTIRPETPEIKGPLREEDIRSIIAMEGREGLNKLKRRRLEEVLSKHPRVNPKMRDYILFQWDTNENIKDDPNALWSCLRDSGLEPSVAKTITDSVWSLESKYAHLLIEQGTQPKYYTPFSSQTTYSQQPPYYPITQSNTSLNLTPGQPYIPTQPSISPYDRLYPQYRIETPPPPSRFSYDYSPPQQQQQVQLTPEVLRAIIREEIEARNRQNKLQILEQKLQVLEVQLNNILQNPNKRPDEIEKIEREFKEEIRAYQEAIEELKDLINQKEKERLEEEIQRLHKEIEHQKQLLINIKENAAPKIESYQSDSFRFLSEVGSELSKRKPLETLGRILFPERFVGPPSAPRPASLPSSLMAQLAQEGMVE